MIAAERKFVGPAMYMMITNFMITIHFWVGMLND